MEVSVEGLLEGKEGLLEQLQSFFKEEELEKLARESRFVERSTSRLSGWMFLQLHLLMESNGKEFSLSDMCQEVSERHGVELTKQSLDGRFNTFAVGFMRQCYQLLLRQVLDVGQQQAAHPHFSRVIVTDSTSFQLPGQLAAFYRSNGGSTSGASVKLHQQYELLQGSILRLEVRDGKENDTLFLQGLSYEQAGKELHILDLGYYKPRHLQALDRAGGFFISRYKTGTRLYIEDEAGKLVLLDWQQFLGRLEKGSNCLPEVSLGKGKDKLKVRLVAQKVPAEVAEQRAKKQQRKQANQSKSGKYSWQTSEAKKQLMGYNIYITNTCPEQLSPLQVQLYYRLRWQIELLFKIWKSIMEIDKVGRMSIFRFECYLYSRLIAILLSAQVQHMLKGYLEQQLEDFELSEWKVMKHLKKRYSSFARHSAKAAEP
ncbi:IS4 family transposase [Pontibacter diazotrophicus]|uniref:IS4 family transposase n=1 Tax=Pontibacter diazotrophicus TaxID=1400979 RepID=A0A3D8KYG5_9BACT|nr:IS4 family transposase [Pontibacter diazotrophicus]RDV10240.1 IS4 family transposase [Pontibacter diazotrophicus]